MDAALPPRPLLRPGLRVVRRDAGHLQVGTEPGARLVLPDRPEARALLDDLAAARRPTLTDPSQQRWVRDLLVRGLVVDADRLSADLAGTVPRPAAMAAYAQSGPDAQARLAGRAQATVQVVAPAPWRDVLVGLLGAAGVRTADVASRRAGVVVVVEPGGELPRADLEGWMRSDRAHLVARNLAGRVELGPFVVPGITACLGCVDAHRADRDPGRGLVVQQHGPRDGEPCDPLLMRLGLAWLARDLVSFVEGEQPRTWSASVQVDETLSMARTEWRRHPRCGCSWGDALAAG